MNSILIGNGFDIQVGGDDYLNKWILIRMLAKAKMGKYDELFMDVNSKQPLISGDELVELFCNIVSIANKAIERKYDDLVNDFKDNDLVKALDDFKSNHKQGVKSFEEVGMEDWLLIFMIYLIEQQDLLGEYKSVKQGFERMIFDAIYCEGNIQKLYLGLNKSVKTYFNNFDNIFTLNYDNTVEKLMNRQVFHLHGDFETKHPSENEKNASGYLRIQSGNNVKFPKQFEHCFGTAILDFSGNKKYKYASEMTTAFDVVERYKESIHRGLISVDNCINNVPLDSQEIVKTAITNDLSVGQNYYFNEFKQLTGTLTIIGLAPQNDSHIFSCINESDLENVIFYCFFGNKTPDEIETEAKNITLPINKKYEIKNIQDVWDEIKISKPEKKKYNISDIQLNILNAISQAPAISKEDLLWQLESVPPTTKKIIYELVVFEMKKNKYHTSPKEEKELLSQFKEFGKVLDVISISPQVLYYFYITSISSSKKKPINKRKSKKRK